MNTIEQLIQQYCPNGVKWVKLGDVGNFENIGVDKKSLPNEHEVVLLNYVDIYHNRYITPDIPKMIVTANDKKRQQCTVEKGDIFITPTSETIDDIGHSALIIETIPNAVYSYHIMRYRLQQINMTTCRYINYLFESNIIQKQIDKVAQGLTRFGVSKNNFAEMVIPLPPLPIQQEIVRILDNMTALVENIEQEIVERKKQYEALRAKLLTFDDNVSRVKLGDVCNTIVPPCKLRTNEYNKIGDFPIIDQGKQSIIGYTSDVKSVLPDNEYILYGDHTCYVKYHKGRFAQGADGLKILISKNGLSKYIYYAVYTFNISSDEYKRHWAQAKEILIPLPPLPIQQQIVDQLDAMVALIENLEQELSERRKQYAYYREKLLTF